MIRMQSARWIADLRLNNQAMELCMHVANAKQPFALMDLFPTDRDQRDCRSMGNQTQSGR